MILLPCWQPISSSRRASLASFWYSSHTSTILTKEKLLRTILQQTIECFQWPESQSARRLSFLRERTRSQMYAIWIIMVKVYRSSREEFFRSTFSSLGISTLVTRHSVMRIRIRPTGTQAKYSIKQSNKKFTPYCKTVNSSGSRNRDKKISASPPGSGSAWTDAHPDPGGKKA